MEYTEYGTVMTCPNCGARMHEPFVGIISEIEGAYGDRIPVMRSLKYLHCPLCGAKIN